MPRLSAGRPKSFTKRGLRMSSPTMTTRLPSRASDMARLVETNDLPSPGMQLVQAMMHSLSSSTKRRLVRRPRKLSSIVSLLFSRTASLRSPSSVLGPMGISASRGSLVSFSTSSRPSILYRSRLSRYTRPTGNTRPNTSAPSMIILPLGDTLPSERGASMMRALAAVLASEM